MFPGWIGFSGPFKKQFGYYPEREILVALGKMSKVQREDHTWFGLYFWGIRKEKEGKGHELIVHSLRDII